MYCFLLNFNVEQSNVERFYIYKGTYIQGIIVGTYIQGIVGTYFYLHYLLNIVVTLHYYIQYIRMEDTDLSATHAF